MTKLSLRSVSLVVALCFLAVGMASAGSTTVPFPTAGNAYCSASNGCGTIASGGTTAPQWTAGDYVLSSVFVLPTTSVTGLTENWQVQDYLGDPGTGPNTETWSIFINGTQVGSVLVPDDSYNGDTLTFTDSFTFAGIAPVGGGYQLELMLQNTVPFGGGSVVWLDGGTTQLTYAAAAVPEPGIMMLLGTSVLGVAGFGV